MKLPDELQKTLEQIAKPEGRTIRQLSQPSGLRAAVRSLKELEALGLIECTGYVSERDRRKARKRRRRR